jgi:type III restriction enzyme
MDNRFFERPILNSPYDHPARHWELDALGQPTQQIIETRRPAKYITPIPRPKKRKTAAAQTEAAPNARAGKRFLEHLTDANNSAAPDLLRLALKMATGAGKTTVMAMLIAWQTINAFRRPGSRRFSRGFLVVTPGITIKDRLRVLWPNDPGSYYQSRELVPGDMLPDMERAKIVITNFHAFKLRERVEVSKSGRLLLQGRQGAPLNTLETEGQMIQRVMLDLMGMKNILVFNDEAHHCYRAKPEKGEEEDLTGDDRKEAERNNEAARLWISGLEAVNRKLGITRVFDLSATPFFLRGSGYAEGTLFPWTMSDFSLMDAIECGIVKLPRVPVADNIPGEEMPMYRNLWEHIRKDMPRKGRAKTASRTRPSGNPFSPCRRLSGRTARREAERIIQRRFRPGIDSRPRRTDHNEEPGDHRRGRRSESDPYG